MSLKEWQALWQLPDPILRQIKLKEVYMHIVKDSSSDVRLSKEQFRIFVSHIIGLTEEEK